MALAERTLWSGIAVADLHRLADAHADDARHVAALLLVDDHRRGGMGKVRPEPAGDVDEHVPQPAVAVDDVTRRLLAGAGQYTHWRSASRRTI